MKRSITFILVLLLVLPLPVLAKSSQSPASKQTSTSEQASTYKEPSSPGQSTTSNQPDRSSQSEKDNQRKTFDYTQGQTGNGKYITYTFQDITLYLPIEWKDLYIADQEDDGVYFCHKASHDKYLEDDIQKGGLLFALCASQDESYKDLPDYKYLGYSENANLHFYLMLPSDYPAYPEEAIKAEYDKMASQIDIIVDKARISTGPGSDPGNSTWPDIA